jgi:membrane fusion protein, multidrug efflux system
MRTAELRLRLSQGLRTSARTVGRITMFALVAALLVSGVLVLRRLDALPRTDDAIVTANTIRVVPEVAGRIATLNVKDDATVDRGEVLFTIESERYELNLAQARAQVQALEAQINLTDRAVSSQVTGISVARANAEWHAPG